MREQINKFLRDPDPVKRRLAGAWAAGIGLQAVDGLEPSGRLLELAVESIDGRATPDGARRLVHGEADLAACGIARELLDGKFSFRPETLAAIHGRIFDGVFDHAGRFRDYDFVKREWVLGGDTVSYAHYVDLGAILDFDFGKEKKTDCRAFSGIEAAHHAARFAAGIWQAHPFCEGNTRAVAVFIIRHLAAKGFAADCACFLESSRFFRDALARANYENRRIGVLPDFSFLEKFFENLVAGRRNPLERARMRVGFNL